jgi:diguanylate cyclase (GGDEF)-like protein/PAS domain S-box-containing protein
VQDAINYLLNTASFVPHGYCLLWRPDLVWVHAVSDLLIALAYFSIPLALVDFVRRRQDLQFKWIFWMFAAFITACGLTHVAGLVTLWQPYYGAQGLIKAWTALVSVGTAIAIWPLIPKAVALPSPIQLEAANDQLQGEISQRIGAENALRRANDELELRIRELAEANQLLRREIQDRERAESGLRRAFAMLDHHVNNTPLGVIEWEQDRTTGDPARVRRWSGRAQAIFGWTEAEILGRTAEEFRLYYEGDATRASDSREDLTERRQPHNSVNLRCYTKERKVRHCRWYNSALHSADTGGIAILSLVEDVTEHVLALEDIYRLAHHDTLTGLPNRVMLYDRLRQALIGAQRRMQGLAVMMLDLDHFKNVNDTLGHNAGDNLLQEVARRFQGRLRASDTLARVGGDEFVLVQEDLTDPIGASVMASKLVTALAEPFDLQGNRLHIGTSIGITLYPDDGADPDILLRNADLALYRAKHEGRGRYQFYDREMDLELRHTRSLENGLRQALEERTLELFYQPTFSLYDGRIQGVEALLRWPCPGRGQVMPESFIPIAETSGLIAPLGEWVLREACRQAQIWRKAGCHLRMAVNLSPIQLREPDFPLLVESVLAENELMGDALELEVTERVFLDPSKAAIANTLREVTDMGVKLAIDDFGTGYSSLGYLKHFPFDRIKVDASFVQDIGIESGTETIVQAIIMLSRNLGKFVTAEGVETDLQLSFCVITCVTRRKVFCLPIQPRPIP